MQLLLFVSALLCIAATPVYCSEVDVELETSIVDLSEEPHLYRFTPACSALLAKNTSAQAIAAAVAGNLAMMQTYYGCGSNCTKRLVAAFRNNWPSRWDEFEGVAECLSRAGVTSVTASKLAMVSYMYEITRANVVSSKRAEDVPVLPLGCAGVLTCAPSGAVLHGRNFDWAPPVSTYMSLTTMNLRYDAPSDSETIKHSHADVDLMLGVFGVSTGVSEAFGVSANSRQYHQPLEDILQCIESDSGMLGAHTAPAGHFIRWALENVNSYDDAVSVFSRSKRCVPVYVILSGPENGQGSVLTLGSPASSTPVRTLGCTSSDWYLVQTNWDNESHSTNNGQMFDTRWTRLEERLDKVGRNVFKRNSAGAKNMWEVLSMSGNSSDCTGVTGRCLYSVMSDTSFMSTVYSAVVDPKSASFAITAARSFD